MILLQDRKINVRINADLRISFKRVKQKEKCRLSMKKIEIAADNLLIRVINNPLYIRSEVELKPGQNERYVKGQMYHYLLNI